MHTRHGSGGLFSGGPRGLANGRPDLRAPRRCHACVGAYTGMLKRLHLALMVTPVIASFLSITILPVRAADASDNPGALTATTDEHGRRVWVNESTTKPKPVRQNQSWAPSGRP